MVKEILDLQTAHLWKKGESENEKQMHSHPDDIHPVL